MPIRFVQYPNNDICYRCKNCYIPLLEESAVLARDYVCDGQAYLVEKVLNVEKALLLQRNMISGRYRVWDIYCKSCRTIVGWTYHSAEDEKNNYKIGRSVISLCRLVKVTTLHTPD